jgi:CNT family concentrative nucleoside transporter
MQILMSLAGMVLILAIAFLLILNRKAIRPRVVSAALQAVSGAGALCAVGQPVLQGAAAGVSTFWAMPMRRKFLLAGWRPIRWGRAIQALPVIAAAFIDHYYLGLMQYVIRWIGEACRKSPAFRRSKAVRD